MATLFVGLGAALGGVLRYQIGLWVAASQGSTSAIPWGTLAINITGSFLLGFLMRYLPTHPIGGELHAEIRLGLTVGLCGGYTTFSTFSFETIALFADGAWGTGATYLLASAILAPAACLAGYMLGRSSAG